MTVPPQVLRVDRVTRVDDVPQFIKQVAPHQGRLVEARDFGFHSVLLVRRVESAAGSEDGGTLRKLSHNGMDRLAVRGFFRYHVIPEAIISQALDGRGY